ncbi:DUF3828 domain-containing protein [Kaistia terrae]|jgi:hypothetical protein|uniref:DUF3828 domain-containing protein n=1 Tax=Kaistia terrae TaxID=537017 RepID=A0ABW0PZI0_9HYPH|nr:DUF3828 domain-containing protein [Kaistia terrae]MCX5581606.1 DUF3828 domain-containing protein [Kaistia terrae]
MSLTRRGIAHLLLVATLGVSLTSTSIGSSVAADDPPFFGDPAAFVSAIYERYEPGGEGMPLDSAETIRSLFEPRLAQRMIDDSAEAAAIGDAPKLDGDPFIDAQDWDIADIRIDVEASTPERAEGHVTFVNFGEAKRIDLQLVLLEDGWRIRDILFPNRSLRGLYSH